MGGSPGPVSAARHPVHSSLSTCRTAAAQAMLSPRKLRVSTPRSARSLSEARSKIRQNQFVALKESERIAGVRAAVGGEPETIQSTPRNDDPPFMCTPARVYEGATHTPRPPPRGNFTAKFIEEIRAARTPKAEGESEERRAALVALALRAKAEAKVAAHKADLARARAAAAVAANVAAEEERATNAKAQAKARPYHLLGYDTASTIVSSTQAEQLLHWVKESTFEYGIPTNGKGSPRAHG
jgi:hypothetical protein